MIKARIFNCVADYTYYQNGQSVYLTYCSVMAYEWDTKEGKLYYRNGISTDLQVLDVYYVHIAGDEMDIVCKD